MPRAMRDINALSASPADDDHRLLARSLGDAAERVYANAVLRPAPSLGCALDALRAERFSIVFTEADLSPGSWRDLLSAAQAQRNPPLLIVTSRLADEHLWAEVLNLGGYDLAAKPFDREELARILSSALRHTLSDRRAIAIESPGALRRADPL